MSIKCNGPFKSSRYTNYSKSFSGRRFFSQSRAFPVLHKESFWDGYKAYKNPSAADAPSPASDGQGSKFPSPFHRARRHISPLLLLNMFSIAERYAPSSSLPSSLLREPTPMWTAGDQYFNVAKTLLDNTYASSLPSTVQALLLPGYREIGIGAMAKPGCTWVWQYVWRRILILDTALALSRDGTDCIIIYLDTALA
ncbi:hypothetical protein DFJ58DRAFT_732741 [Suillus subalutaceus]|uniref:uncharacterized protein n=1 Tax=Suillus subalutaceus TaxID=48586 RepID=UPI001B869477|nr:uncharacterized protein DFJ58DRAFT_732741 [Suillus subalutaceus]KAG1840691.1 hypothetical protein DFJ58DRAFT_732741 [Suillus subalutaceus]